MLVALVLNTNLSKVMSYWCTVDSVESVVTNPAASNIVLVTVMELPYFTLK
jgi:hypothetical protein